ncbi:MAG: porphobilinogen synthase [Candidatus Omnitrophica bacterium]|nr:porphobilinogen synthase [Candidatus Omnitrophota bacterium]MDE2009698.1 porphobilinogen synthase [Candidatus Omnitrophota bacterium]MDE2213905.1 porphobilinogen synthase [Candidatus Omnitrophota bacterium]MDE2231836.1 porphobilinogen synthase [Candidatus Omnitrophota bacterium]
MPHRYRRLRASAAIRGLVRETHLLADDLLQPFFVIDGKNKKEPIDAMPGVFRYSVDLLLKEIAACVRLGAKGGILFGVSRHKDNTGKYAYAANGPVPCAIKAIKKHFPQFFIVTDVCLCAYMGHGHCGIVEAQKINNDKTLPVLARMALCHAQAGADMVAPSDMMDFRVAAIRQALNKENFQDVGILSYAVKYASAYYGPFREAAHSAPGFGDRRSYQMDAANSREALKEALQDLDEGADMVMVKPALVYLDIVSLLRRKLNVPIVAYNVSGEYAMVKAAAQNGWIDERSLVLETLTSIKRAGADIIISYHAKAALEWLR